MISFVLGGICSGCGHVQVSLCEPAWRLEAHLNSDSLGAVLLVFETRSLTLVLDRVLEISKNTELVAVRFEARPIDYKAQAI